jgi:hypothetical protein
MTLSLKESKRLILELKRENETLKEEIYNLSNPSETKKPQPIQEPKNKRGLCSKNGLYEKRGLTNKERWAWWDSRAGWKRNWEELFSRNKWKLIK